MELDKIKGLSVKKIRTTLDFAFLSCNNIPIGEDNAMLTRFSVENFKNFKDKFVFDLHQSNYEFNSQAVKDGIVNKGLIYGHNGCLRNYNKSYVNML